MTLLYIKHKDGYGSLFVSIGKQYANRETVIFHNKLKGLYVNKSGEYIT